MYYETSTYYSTIVVHSTGRTTTKTTKAIMYLCPKRLLNLCFSHNHSCNCQNDFISLIYYCKLSMDHIKIAPKKYKNSSKNDRNPSKKYKIDPMVFSPKNDRNPSKKYKIGPMVFSPKNTKI